MLEWVKQNLLALVVSIASLVGMYTTMQIQLATMDQRISAVEAYSDDKDVYLTRVSKVEYESTVNSKDITSLNHSFKSLDKRVTDNTVANAETIKVLEGVSETLTMMNSSITEQTKATNALIKQVVRLETRVDIAGSSK